MNNPPKILIIDDTPANVLLLCQMLRWAGYHVLSAEGGADGYNLAVSQRPDLILLDVEMPGMDGYEVCSALKMNKCTSDIPVIFVTARTETVDKVKGLDIGGVDYITKPFQHAEVTARIRAHLRLMAIYEKEPDAGT